MFCSFPYEWRQHMIDGAVRTFKSNTPRDIIDQAKKINEKSLEYEGSPYFFFEEEN